jgi:hypothetical protein
MELGENANIPVDGPALRTARKAAGLKVRELALKAGCTHAYISILETQPDRYCSPGLFLRICGALGDRAPGSSQAKNSEGFAFELYAGGRLPMPLAQRVIRLGNTARERENHSKDMLRDRRSRYAGRCGDGDPEFRGGANVDAVRTGGGDEAKLRQGSQDV